MPESLIIQDFDKHDDDFPPTVKIGRLKPLQSFVRGEGGGRRVNVNATDHDGFTLLHHVVLTSTRETKSCIAYLLRKKANINAISLETGETPLHRLLSVGDATVAEDIALFLMENGADVNIRNQRLRSSYDLALAHGFTRLAAIMYGEPQPQYSFNTPRLQAPNGVGQDVIQQAPGQQARIPTKNDGTYDPEQDKVVVAKSIATQTEREGMPVEVANISDTTEHDKTRARLALDARRAEEFGKSLIEAVLIGDTREAKHCLKKGANANILNKSGAGPLHYAVHLCPKNRTKMIELLCEGGADVNLLDYENDTALNLAIKTESNVSSGELLSIVKVLLTYRAKTHFKDLDENNAVDLCKMKNLHEVLKLLEEGPGKFRTAGHFKDEEIDYLADEDDEEGVGNRQRRTEALPELDHSQPDENGFYPLHLLVMNESLNEDEKKELFETFYEQGIDFNVGSAKSKDTALHMAVSVNERRTVRNLFALGADPDKPNEDGITARQLAERSSDERMRSVFKADYIDSESEDEDDDEDETDPAVDGKKKGKTCTIL